MIRILQVVTHMNRGGLETMLMNYYRNIDRNKVQFDFLTHRPYDGDYGDEIKSMGGMIYHIPHLNPISKKYRTILEDFFYKHNEYKIIHVHQDCMSSVVLKIAKKVGIEVRIAHSHSSSQDKNIKYLIKLLYKKDITKYATNLMACGKEAGDWMFGGSDYHILNNAIEAKRYVYNPEKKHLMRVALGIDDTTLIVGHVGRFSPPKNHTFLIEIFKAIHEKIPDSILLLVGNDKDKIADEVKSKVKKYNLEKQVMFTGVRSDVSEIMQAMDAFVFPSLYEGLPVTMVEAQASGLPCLISDKVPIECKLTDEVSQIRLSESADEWAKKTIEMTKNVRKNNLLIIKSTGFDITENAKWLQDFYLMKYYEVNNS